MLKKQGREETECFLGKIDIFLQFPEAGQCPLCRKIWNEDGREIIVTGHIDVVLKEKEYNPSRREDRE
jgi:hypothetical protein